VKYLEYTAQSLDPVTLDIVNECVMKDPFIDKSPALLLSVNERLRSLRSPKSPLSDSKTSEEPSTNSIEWRTRINAQLNALVAPHDVSWMDDEVLLTDDQYTSRALSELRERFTRQVLPQSRRLSFVHLSLKTSL
jgi:hypothetical protein